MCVNIHTYVAINCIILAWVLNNELKVIFTAAEFLVCGSTIDPAKDTCTVQLDVELKIC